jgi:hypothetical protein
MSLLKSDQTKVITIEVQPKSKSNVYILHIQSHCKFASVTVNTQIEEKEKGQIKENGKRKK